MKTVKALQTLHGSYGLKAAGDTFDAPDSIANQLVASKLVELVEEKSADTKTAQQLQEEATVAKNTEIDAKKAAQPTQPVAAPTPSSAPAPAAKPIQTNPAK